VGASGGRWGFWWEKEGEGRRSGREGARVEVGVEQLGQVEGRVRLEGSQLMIEPRKDDMKDLKGVNVGFGVITGLLYCFLRGFRWSK